jgi:hypothetical protein
LWAVGLEEVATQTAGLGWLLDLLAEIHWQHGYGVFSVSQSNVEQVKDSFSGFLSASGCSLPCANHKQATHSSGAPNC